MRKLLLLVLAACAAETPIDARSAAPKHIAEGATIMRGNDTLEAGTTGWVCLAEEPPICMDEEFRKWRAGEPITGMAVAYQGAQVLIALPNPEALASLPPALVREAGTPRAHLALPAEPAPADSVR